jgi:hypothetical protein
MIKRFAFAALLQQKTFLSIPRDIFAFESYSKRAKLVAQRFDAINKR